MRNFLARGATDGAHTANLVGMGTFPVNDPGLRTSRDRNCCRPWTDRHCEPELDVMRVANDPPVRPVDSDRVGDLISYRNDGKGRTLMGKKGRES
jgi:hypothetical protein